MNSQTLQHLSAMLSRLKLVELSTRSRSSVLEMLAHPQVSLLRNVECGFRTMSITNLPQHRGHLMLHLVCLRRQDNLMFKVDSPILWLPRPDKDGHVLQVWTARTPCYQLSPESVSEGTMLLSHGKGRAHPRNSNARPPAIGRGHANHVKIEEAQKEPTIVMGTLPVNSATASVLFDSGASHSFISATFALAAWHAI